MRSEKKASKPIEKSEHNHALAFKGLLLLPRLLVPPATAFCASLCHREFRRNSKRKLESTGTENWTTVKKQQWHQRVYERQTWFSFEPCFLLTKRFGAATSFLLVTWTDTLYLLKYIFQNVFSKSPHPIFHKKWLLAFARFVLIKLRLYGPFVNTVTAERSVLLDSLWWLMIYMLYHCGCSSAERVGGHHLHGNDGLS